MTPINLCPFDVYWPIPGDKYKIPAQTQEVTVHTTSSDTQIIVGETRLKFGTCVIVPNNPHAIEQAMRAGLLVYNGISEGSTIRYLGYGTFHIIDTDNFGGDYPDEKWIARDIKNPHWAQTMCDAMNAKYGGEHASRCYRVVPDDYVLQPGFSP